MPQKSAASRRYALALVESVTHAKDISLDEALGQLSLFNDAVEKSFDLKNALLNPAFTRDERDKLVTAVLGHLKLSPRLQAFVRIVVEARRMGELSEITETFRDLADERRGRRRAVVQSAAPLSPEATERLRQALERKTGHSIDIEVQVDPSLIGGLRTRVGSMVFDGTIRAELDNLRAAIAQGE